MHGVPHYAEPAHFWQDGVRIFLGAVSIKYKVSNNLIGFMWKIASAVDFSKRAKIIFRLSFRALQIPCITSPNKQDCSFAETDDDCASPAVNLHTFCNLYVRLDFQCKNISRGKVSIRAMRQCATHKKPINLLTIYCFALAGATHRHTAMQSLHIDCCRFGMCIVRQSN